MEPRQFIPKSASNSATKILPKFGNVKVWGKKIGPSNNLKYSGKNRIESKIFSINKSVIQKIIGLQDSPNASISESIQDIKTPNQNINDTKDSKNYSQETIEPKFDQVNENLKSQSTKKINPTNNFSATQLFETLKKKTKITSSQNFENLDRKINDFEKIEKKSNFEFNLFGNIKKIVNDGTTKWWDSIKFDYYEKEWFRKINYHFWVLDVGKNISKIIIWLCAISLLSFFAYLAFFDQYFTIKKYIIEYSSGSYLNNQQSYQLITHFQKNKLYKVFPNNQYWFANNISLTASAKEVFPDINSVDVKDHIWPNQIKLMVNVQNPILTLAVTENNEQKYWRITDNGKVSSQDKAAIWYNLVKVEKPYILQDTQNQQQLSLLQHSFESNTTQKQRFNLTKQLISYFKSIDINIISTTYPSISDTDIVMQTSSGTRFMFDSLLFDENIQIERVDYFMKAKLEKTDFYNGEKKGNYSYIDFRIPNKIHYCSTKTDCQAKSEN